MADWVGWFARFHTDPAGLYVPYGLRTVDCLVEADGKPAITHRCVREVAKFNGGRGVEWLLITWVPGLPGAQSQHFSSSGEAMAQFDEPPALVKFTVASPPRGSSAHP